MSHPNRNYTRYIVTKTLTAEEKRKLEEAPPRVLYASSPTDTEMSITIMDGTLVQITAPPSVVLTTKDKALQDEINAIRRNP